MRRLVLVFAFLIAGCASQIMQGYVGKTPQDVMVSYGPPSARFDMGDGRVAYQWVLTSSGSTPIVATTQNYGMGVRTTTITGGQSFTNECAYTLFATKNADGREVITSFQKPRLTCE